MQIRYDGAVDALQIILRDGVYADHGEEVAPGVTVDLDAAGNIVGLEVLDAMLRLGAESVRTVQVEYDPPPPGAPQEVVDGQELAGYAIGHPQTWLSGPEAARRACVSRQAVYRAVAEGRLWGLPLRPGSRRIMVAEASLSAWQPDRVRQAAGKAKASL